MIVGCRDRAPTSCAMYPRGFAAMATGVTKWLATGVAVAALSDGPHSVSVRRLWLGLM